MTLDRSFAERNRASTDRIRALATGLTDMEMRHAVGEHWTVAVALAHLAFWDRRAMSILDKRLEGFPAALLEAIYSKNKRWVERALHRNEHLDEVDAALKRRTPKMSDAREAD